jgi:hypothetical protein
VQEEGTGGGAGGRNRGRCKRKEQGGEVALPAAFMRWTQSGVWRSNLEHSLFFVSPQLPCKEQGKERSREKRGGREGWEVGERDGRWERGMGGDYSECVDCESALI